MSSGSSSSFTLLEKPLTVVFVPMISRGEPVRAPASSAACTLRPGASGRVHAQGCVRGSGLPLPPSEGRVQAGPIPSTCAPPPLAKGSLYLAESRAGAKRWSWHPVRAGVRPGVGRETTRARGSFQPAPPCRYRE
ncbi:unnamed protein product [Rangifer tarandus platyrhynchus]|uniref:Uncharacterized protein n=2 Tax=Rangifer tarandus platyrhynchus TaxID=3082113 RepID=A0ABN8Y4Q6_RANTA|nr:unnamed protein product [Rangifer tarandus platyrhynchus]CAI9693141.1 unnamed protein product [Rangifer tarandus platyrhynchus]